jgi:hypothetical protein
MPAAGLLGFVLALPTAGLSWIYFAFEGNALHKQDLLKKGYVSESQFAASIRRHDASVHDSRSAGSSEVDDLVKFAQLHRDGAINDKEFATQKERLLNHRLQVPKSEPGGLELIAGPAPKAGMQPETLSRTAKRKAVLATALLAALGSAWFSLPAVVDPLPLRQGIVRQAESPPIVLAGGCDAMPFEVFPVGQTFESDELSARTKARCPGATRPSDERIEVSWHGATYEVVLQKVMLERRARFKVAKVASVIARKM